MLQNYQVLIEHSQLKWPDTPPQLQNARLIVTVLPDGIHWGDDEHWAMMKWQNCLVWIDVFIRYSYRHLAYPRTPKAE